MEFFFSKEVLTFLFLCFVVTQVYFLTQTAVHDANITMKVFSINSSKAMFLLHLLYSWRHLVLRWEWNHKLSHNQTSTNKT